MTKEDAVTFENIKKDFEKKLQEVQNKNDELKEEVRLLKHDLETLVAMVHAFINDQNAKKEKIAKLFAKNLHENA